MRQGSYSLHDPTCVCANEGVFDGASQVVTHATVSTRQGQLKMLDLYTGLVETNEMDIGVGVNWIDCQGGNNVIAACADGTIKVLDGRLRSQRLRYQQSVQAVSTNARRVSISPAQNLVAVSGGRGEVVIVDLRMVGRAPNRINATMSKPTFLNWLPGEQVDTLLIGSSGQNGTVQISQPLGDPSYVQYLTPTLAHGESISCMDASPSGSYITVGTDGGNIVVFEREGWPKFSQVNQEGQGGKVRLNEEGIHLSRRPQITNNFLLVASLLVPLFASLISEGMRAKLRPSTATGIYRPWRASEEPADQRQPIQRVLSPDPPLNYPNSRRGIQQRRKPTR